ncbi:MULTISPECIES: hypothetical protein [Streptomyces]|uniref:hypothetical protein n=1 Tax=Streptomyces TaxID=1883 RepID=UPI00113CAEB4|nr:hypothetical protein DV517_68430 [Streptomyces sp. S816]
MPSRRTVIGLLTAFAVVFGLAAWYIETQVNASPDANPKRTEVEVTRYSVDQSHGRRMAVAEYVIHNDTVPGPAVYTVTFRFGDDPAFTTTVIKRVGAHDNYTGSVSIPWDRLEALDGVRVLEVQRD